MKNVNYKRLQRYDIGKKQNAFSGYQPGEQIDTSMFSSTPSQSFDGYDDQIRSTIVPSAISKGLGAVSTWVPMFTDGWTTASEAANAASTSGSVAGSVASSAAKVGLNSFGAITGIAGAAMGGINIANDVDAFSDPIITGQDMINSIGRSTQQKYGQSYTTYTGFDEQGIVDTIKAANDRDKTNLTVDTTTTGLTVGATAGSFFGPIGTIAGGALGALGGFFAGLFGGDSAAEERERKARAKMENLRWATSNYNVQAEGEAASMGLRNMFNTNHYNADKGKDVYTNFGEPGKIKMVHTSSGIKPGIELGIAGGKESIVDFGNNTASVIDEGKKRVDNISVGIPLTKAKGYVDDSILYKADSGVEDWDNNVFIAGNVTNPYTGNTIAEDAEPYARNVEKINKQNPMTNLGKKTKEINLRNQMQQLRWLSDVQSAVKDAESYFANCGKLPKHDPGKKLNIDPNDLQPLPYVPYPSTQNKKSAWPNLSGFGDYAAVLVPHLTQLGMLFSDNTDYTPRSFNPYVSSDYYKYIDNMRRRSLDPTQAIKNIQKAQLQNRYAVTHQGGLGAGQIAALSSLSNINAANAINNTIFDYDQKNIALANEADRLGMQAAMSDAARKQQANSSWWENLAKSNSTAYNLKQANKKAKYDQIGALSKDILSMIQYNQAKGFKNRILNMYNQALNTYQQDIIGGLPA